MVYFYKALVQEALKIIEKKQELSDIFNDINRIDFALSMGKNTENLIKAKMLDIELRRKYPTINAMLAISNSLSDNCLPAMQSNELPEYANLKQDYFGILCEVLLKNHIISSMEQFFESVN